MTGGVIVPTIHCRKHPKAALIEDYRAGDMVCSRCGLVVGDRVIDVGPEWRSFANDGNSIHKDRSRAGYSEEPGLEGVGTLSTGIAISKNGKNYNADHEKMSRLQARSEINTQDRSFLKTCREISTMTDRMNLTKNIVVKTQALFKKVYLLKGIKGRSYNAVAAACLYIICRQESVPRTFKEICAVSRITKKEIGRCFKLVLKSISSNVDLVNSVDYMARFCSFLGLNLTIQKISIFIAKRAYELDLVGGKSPITITSSAIFLGCQASGVKKTLKEVSDCTGVAESTIRSTYKLFIKHLNELYPSNFTPVVDASNLPYNNDK